MAHVYTPPPRVKALTDGPAAVVAFWRERLDAPLFVYFIQDGDDGAVKIGKAFNPITRLSELQCGNPRVLNLRAVVFAHYNTEENLHIHWAEYRTRGEWFGSGLRGQGEPDRYNQYGGYVRIQPADHPSVQAEILRQASDAQRKQVEAALTGASDNQIIRISYALRPPEQWNTRKTSERAA